MGREGIRSAYETGRGSLKVRGKAHIEQTSTGRTRIIITEIPYQVNKSKLVAKIADLVREKKLTEICDLRDESDRKGMRVVIELKHDLHPAGRAQQALQAHAAADRLRRHHARARRRRAAHADAARRCSATTSSTRRTSSPGARATSCARPRSAPTSSRATSSRSTTSTRSSRSSAASRDRRRGQGRASWSASGSREIQTDAILEMRLRRLTGLERAQDRGRARRAAREDRLVHRRCSATWASCSRSSRTSSPRSATSSPTSAAPRSPRRPRTSTSRTSSPRRTWSSPSRKAGYVKRLPVATYRQQKRGGKGLQGVNLSENDFVEHLFIASTHDYVLFFSTKGKVYRMKVHELPVGSRHARGTAVVNLLPFEQDEKIAAVITTKDVRRRRVPAVRHQARHGEEDGDAGVRPRAPRRHHRHQPARRRRAHRACAACKPARRS